MRAAILASLVLAPALALAQPAPAAPADDAARQAPVPAGTAQQLVAQVDADWPRRDEPGVLERIRAALDEAERLAPKDYGVLWRQARLSFWLADDPALPGEEKSKLGRRGWEYGERAIAANPGGVEGYHFAAAGMGNYSLGIGIFRALREGIEGKFRDRLGRAEKIDPNFQDGSIQTAWGRFYFKLPWPKYDPQKSERSLLAALKRNPENVRALVYLAELYRKEDHPREARQQLEKAAAHRPGSYDPPEERRYVRVAQDELARTR